MSRPLTDREKALVSCQTRVYEAIKEFRTLKESDLRGAVAGVLSLKETYLLDKVMEAAEQAMGAKHPAGHGRVTKMKGEPRR